jgi:predicted MFS family arabinose efflux permease
VLLQLAWFLVFVSFLVAYAGAPSPWVPHALLAAGAAAFVGNLILELVGDDRIGPVTAAAVGAVGIALGVLGIDVATKAGRDRRGGS